MRNFLKVLKWIGIIAVTMLVITVVALYVLSRDIPPTDVSDLMPPERPDVAPEDNAFTYFAKAEELVSKPVDPVILRDFLNNKPLETNQLLEVFSLNLEVIKQVEEGVKREVCLVPEVSRRVLFYPHISKWNGIGRLLAAKSRYERITGKTSESVSTCITLLKYASLLRHHANNYIYYVTSEMIFNFGLSETKNIAQDNSVEKDDLSRLLKTLDDFPNLNTDKVRVLKREYQNDVKFFSCLIKDYLSAKWNVAPGWAEKIIIQPNMFNDIMAVYYRDYIHNVEDFSFAQSKLMDEEDLRNSVKYSPLNLAVMFMNIGEYWHYMSDSAKNLLGAFYRNECVFSATRLLVALNLYEKRNGKLPDNLEQLVPEYIAAVPRDPYDGKPFRYDRDKQIVYSVGDNVKDEGGSVNKIYRGLSHESVDRYRANDIVFRVSKETSNVD